MNAIESKVCRTCGQELPLDHFYKTGLGYYMSYCKPCSCRKSRDWYRSPKGKKRIRDRNLKRDFGIGTPEYEAMLESQGGVCAICGDQETAWGYHGKLRRLCIDHCHKTGKIRKILCRHCNNGLGHFKDNPELLRKAADYIDEHSA